MSPSSSDAGKQGKRDLTTVELVSSHRCMEVGEMTGSSLGNRSAFRAVHQGERQICIQLIKRWMEKSVESIEEFDDNENLSQKGYLLNMLNYNSCLKLTQLLITVICFARNTQFTRDFWRKSCNS